MAVKDTSKKPYIVDRDSNVKVGVDLPIRRGDSKDGMFASTSTTIEAVKNNIINLLKTNQGERLMQPNIGTDLRTVIFEQITSETLLIIQNKILDSLQIWLPFVEIIDIQVMNDDLEKDFNTVVVKILFNIKNDPTTTDSVDINFSSTITNNINSSTGGGY